MLLNVSAEGDLNAGLNKFVWDMRINRVTTVPNRPPTAVMPIVPPGQYQVKLTVDGGSESQVFEVLMSPKEVYIQDEADAKYAFWMELYNSTEEWTQNVIKALKLKEDLAAKVEAYKKSGSAAKATKAEAQAELVYGIVDAYEGTYVSTGRTLAEVINLPATILFKMSFMSGILDHSEGPVTQSMKAVYQDLIDASKAADDNYNADIKKELAKLDKLLK
jgi:hypothetical protein